MQNDLQTALASAVLHLLKPLARILLRHGMPYGTFAELCRKAFVDAAFEDTSLSSKRPTISSVSAMTGLTRKETKRLKDWDMTDADGSAQRYSRAIRVISGWAETPEFQDDDGKPAVLPLDGADHSFANLVRRFSGDIPTAAMLSVLESSGSVATEDNAVRLLERAYIPKGATEERVNILGTDVAELVATIGHNLEASPEERRFQRKVSNVLVSKDALPAFREYSNQKSQALLEDYHQWLTAHEVKHANAAEAGAEACYAAVGIYYTEHSVTGEEST